MRLFQGGCNQLEGNLKPNHDNLCPASSPVKAAFDAVSWTGVVARIDTLDASV